MNRRLVLLIVLIVLGALAWWLNRNSGTSTLDRPLSDFMIADTSQVDRIFIAEPNGRTVDLRRNGTSWTANGLYRAKQNDINLLLRTFLRIEVKSPVPKAAEANVLRGMGSGAKKVEIYTGGRKPEKIWIVGHGTKDNFGTYMILEKPGEGRSNVPFVMGMSGFTGILGPRFHANIDDWRSSLVFHYPDLYDVAQVEVERPEAPGTAYRITQLQGGKVQLTDLKGATLPMDSVLVRGALLPFTQLNYEYIDRNLTRTQRDSLLATPPNHVVRLTERNGTVRSARFWYMPYEGDMSAPDAAQQLHDKVRMRALVEDTLVVVVQRQLFDRILQPSTAFLP